MANPDPDLTIKAWPTKNLFIMMLTRDVGLIPAIVDLADNSTDGARHLRKDATGKKPWDGLEVMIKADRGAFSITDNCGGMTVKTAREYAFRFGRDEDAPVHAGDVGRFGVGMKRGLFKLGRHFHIRSTTRRTRFDVTIDVEKWARDKGTDWTFEFDAAPIVDGSFSSADWGTQITVTKLHENVAEQLARPQFIQDLRDNLSAKLEPSLEKGLAVRVNGQSLKFDVRNLVSDAALAPVKKQFVKIGPSGKKVHIELWAGLGKPGKPAEARDQSGWYVFCNDRMLLEADKTTSTVWGHAEPGREAIPRHHAQFNDFRGYAYIEADDATDLPWNTSKTALDTDHQIYRAVQQEMIALSRPVINYFNKRKDENDNLKAADRPDEVGRLQQLFNTASVAPLSKVKTRTTFTTPPVGKLRKVAVKQAIAFKVDPERATKVRDSLRARSWPKVGEGVFDYYFSAECEDD